MNKAELILSVSERTELPKKDVEDAICAALDVIIETMAQGERVQLVGFGSFEPKKRAARQGRNPHTGEVIQIPPAVAATFRPGKAMRDAVVK